VQAEIQAQGCPVEQARQSCGEAASQGVQSSVRYFLDTEFNGYLGELISLALVAEDGRELYLMNIDRLENSIDWVRDNVIPVLSVAGADPLCSTLEQITHEVEKFLAKDDNPHVIVDWPDDIKYFCEVLITGPGEMIRVPRMNFELARVDAYPSKLEGAVQHNALWDARALAYLFVRRSLPPGVHCR
jgi:hypothetical protein